METSSSSTSSSGSTVSSSSTGSSLSSTGTGSSLDSGSGTVHISIGSSSSTSSMISTDTSISSLHGSVNDVGSTRTWTGSGTDTLCSTPANWGGTIPQTGDNIVINSGSKNVTWDAGCPSTVNSFLMDTGYTGTVTIDTVYDGQGSFTTFTVTNDLTINSGTMTHDQNTNTETYRLKVSVGRNLTVGSGGSMNVDGKGYWHAAAYGTWGVGPGAPPDRWLPSGGGYGGQGGLAPIWGPAGIGRTYGSITAPTDIGSTGEMNNGGPSGGGGAIMLTVAGLTTINGTISAMGLSGSPGGWCAGKGSGGSAYITTGSLTGTGTITVDGGSSGPYNVGSGGGGGRIALVLTNSSSFGSVNLRASGGGFADSGDYPGINGGASGTIYLQTKDQTNLTGQLIIPTTYLYRDPATGYVLSSSSVIAGTTEYPTTSYTTLSDSATVSYSFSSIRVGSHARFEIGSDDSLTLSSGGTLSIASGSTLVNNGTLTLSGANLTNLGTFTSSPGSTTTYLGTSDHAPVALFGGTYGNLTVNNAGTTFTQSGAAIVQGQLAITAGTYNLGGQNLTMTGSSASFTNADTLSLRGNETVSNLVPGTTGTIVYTGTSGPYVLQQWAYPNLFIEGTGAIFSLPANTSVTGNLTIQKGTLNLNGKNVAISGTFQNADTLELQGGETIPSPALLSGSTVIYNAPSGSNFSIRNWAYPNLTISGSGASFGLPASTSIGNLSVRGGTLYLLGNNTVNTALSVDAGGTLRLNGFALDVRQATFTNNGHVARGSGSLLARSSLSAPQSASGSSILYALTAPAMNLDGSMKDTATVDIDGIPTLFVETAPSSGVFEASFSIPTLLPTECPNKIITAIFSDLNSTSLTASASTDVYNTSTSCNPPAGGSRGVAGGTNRMGISQPSAPVGVQGENENLSLPPISSSLLPTLPPSALSLTQRVLLRKQKRLALHGAQSHSAAQASMLAQRVLQRKLKRMQKWGIEFTSAPSSTQMISSR